MFEKLFDISATGTPCRVEDHAHIFPSVQNADRQETTWSLFFACWCDLGSVIPCYVDVLDSHISLLVIIGTSTIYTFAAGWSLLVGVRRDL